MSSNKTINRKVVYVLGAGFSLGSCHFATHAKARIDMPLQRSFFKVLSDYKNKQTRTLDELSKNIRLYFSPNTYRTTREKGRARHSDLDNLSIEEVVTFFDEMAKTGTSTEQQIARKVNDDLIKLAAQLISHLSLRGSPGRNAILKKFVRDRVKRVDTIVTFNWDTLLDRVLSNNFSRTKWNRGYGYGKTVRQQFPYKKWRGNIPEHYPKLLKLHGSVNWVRRDNGGQVLESWAAKNKFNNVCMMAPKMIKSKELEGEGLYKELWTEAQKQLLRSKRIVFIGYSFPPADYAVANMLRRVFSMKKKQRKKVPEIVVVDPEALERSKYFKQSFGIHIEAENMFLSLKSFVGGSGLR